MMQTGGTFVRDATLITLCVNEGISVLENLGLMGVPIPKPIKNAIDILARKNNKEE
jgi:phage-related holin